MELSRDPFSVDSGIELSRDPFSVESGIELRSRDLSMFSISLRSLRLLFFCPAGAVVVVVTVIGLGELGEFAVLTFVVITLGELFAVTFVTFVVITLGEVSSSLGIEVLSFALEVLLEKKFSNLDIVVVENDFSLAVSGKETCLNFFPDSGEPISGEEESLPNFSGEEESLPCNFVATFLTLYIIPQKLVFFLPLLSAMLRTSSRLDLSTVTLSV